MDSKNLTSVEEALKALSQLELYLIGNEVKIKRKDIFKGKLIIEAKNGDVLCEIIPGPIFKSSHLTTCKVFDIVLDLFIEGFFNKNLRLQVDNHPLLSVKKELFSKLLLAYGWDDNSWVIRQRGIMLKRKYELSDVLYNELFRFHFTPFPFAVSLFTFPSHQIKAGLIAALAILLFYDWYHSVRTTILFTVDAVGA